MTYEELNRYNKLKLLVDDLDHRISTLREQLKNNAHDVVRGSSREFPYTNKPFYIAGTKGNKKLREMERRWLIEVSKAEEELQLLDEFINKITDVENRIIFRKIFIDGMTQQQVAMIMHMDQSTISDRIHRYLKKHTTK